jgi:glycosyltransferase involved in cell wall biosynthesis
MAPPLALTVLCLVRRRKGGVLVVDAHTRAVLRHDSVRPTFVALARRADVVIVASEALRARLAEHGVEALAIHDPLGRRSPTLAEGGGPAPRSRFVVVFPAGWRDDEPVPALLEAARLVPDIDIVITGRSTPALTVPANVRLTGYLDEDRYTTLLASAGAVLALTTRSMTMQRAGYEAMEHGRPLVASDTDVLREFFTAGTVFASPDAASLAAAIEEARRRAPELSAEMAVLREARVAEDQRAAEVLRAAISSARERR